MVAMNFDSHPLTEDDLMGIDVSSVIDISTHILSQRMTYSGGKDSDVMLISTHILSQRMTSPQKPYASIPEYFDSHPLTEDDD